MEVFPLLKVLRYRQPVMTLILDTDLRRPSRRIFVRATPSSDIVRPLVSVRCATEAVDELFMVVYSLKSDLVVIGSSSHVCATVEYKYWCRCHSVASLSPMKFGRKITVRVPTLLLNVLINYGDHIQANLYIEWRPFYLDYNLLKYKLKVGRQVYILFDVADLPPPSLVQPFMSGTIRMNRISLTCWRRSSTRFMTFKKQRFAPVPFFHTGRFLMRP